jgi:16S rRNA (guanine527-N7)-methyltransferase
MALPSLGGVSREIIELTAEQQRQLDAALALIESDERAPTAVRVRELAERTHVADSLVALEIAAVRGAQVVADLGSGSGFPGLALAIALPAARVELIESQRRKCEFLERLCATAQAHNASVVCSRVEEWQAGIGRCDLVVVRALAPQPVVLEYAAPLLRMGGTLVDWRGRRDAAAEQAGDRAAELLGLRSQEVRHVVPFPAAADRHLHVFTKVGETPARYPRRAGMARKRPLAA